MWLYEHIEVQVCIELNSATVSTTVDKLPNYFWQSYYYYKTRAKNQVTLRSYVISYCCLTN